MNESETRAELIDPALQAAGDGYVDHYGSVESGKIKLADPSQTSTRYRSYRPVWA
jgi:hypothetical protein